MMLLKPLLATLVLTVGILAAPSLHAGDYCSDVPVCSTSQNLVFLESDQREDCAIFRCMGADTQTATGTVVTSDQQLKHILTYDGSAQCPKGMVHAKPANGTNIRWTCVAVADASQYAEYITVSSNGKVIAPLSSLTCKQNYTPVYMKVDIFKSKGQPRCIDTDKYAYYKQKGYIASEGEVDLLAEMPDMTCEDDKYLAYMDAGGSTGWQCVTTTYYDMVKVQQRKRGPAN